MTHVDVIFGVVGACRQSMVDPAETRALSLWSPGGRLEVKEKLVEKSCAADGQMSVLQKRAPWLFRDI